MSSSARRSHDSTRRWPMRAIALFALVVIGVYSLVFFTGDKTASPKLGIDLQGGTRVTLVPQGAEPTREQLEDARNILENRVNGMGVSGASVVVDGNTLVITAAGDDTSQVRNIGQTSQLLFRPVLENPTADPASVEQTLLDTATTWVELGVMPKEQAQLAINQVFAPQTEGEEEAAEAPQLEATPLPEPNGPVEASERRQEVAEALRATRQSTDPTQQFAAMALMQGSCLLQTVDPLAGSDDETLPLVACDPSRGQVLLLDEVPLLAGVSDPDGPRLTGEQIDTGRQITGGPNIQTGPVSYTHLTLPTKRIV